MTRQVCLWVPSWPIAAAIAEGLIPPDAPAAIHDAREVRDVTPAASRAGVRRGMRRRQAAATCPELIVLPDDPVREARVFETVLGGIEQVIALPLIVRPGLVLADARGPARHCGGEWPLAEQLTGAVIEASGAEPSVGIADGTLAAILAARVGCVIEDAQTREFLAGHRMTALQALVPDREMAELIELCERFGIRTLGDFLALPRGAVATRFGARGTLAYDLASGRDVVVPRASQERSEVSAGREVDPPLATSDAAAFLARALAEELAGRLAGRSCTQLRITARTTAGTTHERTWMITPDTQLTPAAMTDRVRWQLDAWLGGTDRPDGQLTHLQLCAQGRGAEYGTPLWGRGTDRERIDRARSRLQSLAGISTVHVIAERGGRDPRSRIAVVPAVAATSEPVRSGPWAGTLLGPAPTVVLEKTLPVRLFDADGAAIPVPPAHRGWMSAPASYRMSGLPAVPEAGRVVQWAGPWPLIERWWEGVPERCYLQLVIEAGPPLLVVGVGGTWRIEGHYD